MRAASQTQPPEPRTGLGGQPLPPRPFNMEQWRREWGAFWGRANREAINAAIKRVG